MARIPIPTADTGSGLLVPTYAELAPQASTPAAPAAGKTRLYIDGNGLLQLLPSSGSSRRIAAHWGSGTAFPAGAQQGDTFVLTTGGVNTLWEYNGARWIMEEPPSFATVAARDTWTTALPAGAAYEGMQVWMSAQGQFHAWTAATNYTSHWRGTNSFVFSPSIAFNNIVNATGDGTAGCATNTNYSDNIWRAFGQTATFPDPGYPYRIEADLRIEFQTAQTSRVNFRVHLGTSNIDVILAYYCTPLAATWFQASFHGISGPVQGSQVSVHWDFQTTGSIATQVTSYMNGWTGRCIPYTQGDGNI